MSQLYAPQRRVDIGGVLSAAFDLLRRRGLAPWLAQAVVCGGLGVTQMVLAVSVAGTRAFGRPTDTSGFSAVLGVVSVLILLAQYAFALSLMTRAAMTGPEAPRPRIGELLAGALGRFLPVVLVLVGWLVAVLVGYVLLIIPAILVSLYFAVVAQVSAAESVGWLQAFRRSVELTDGNRWTIFLVRLVWGVMNGIIVVVSMLLAMTVIGLFTALPNTSDSVIGAVALILILPLSFLFSAGIQVFNAALPAALYVELRRVKEGDRAQAIEQVFS